MSRATATAGTAAAAANRRAAPRLLLASVAAVTALGLLLRLPSYGDSLFGDELSTYFIVTGHSLGRVLHLLGGNSVDFSPPLFLVAAWAFGKVGNDPQWLRLTSLLAGTAAIPLTYLLGTWTVTRPAALIGCFLTAFSPFMIFYSTEARSYGLLLAFSLLSTIALLRALERGSVRWWVAYAAFSCAAIYTQYVAVFLLVGQFAWAAWTHPKARLRLVAANAAAAIAYLPWLPTLLDNADSPGAKTIGILEPFTLGAVRTDLGKWAFGHPLFAVTSVPGDIPIAMLAGGLAAAIVGVARRRLATVGGFPRPSAESGLVAVLALATPVGLALYSVVGDSVWEPRNLIASYPGLALAAGALLTAATGVLRLAAICLVVGAVAIGGVEMLDSANRRTDYVGAARFIDQAAAPGDPVVEIPFPTPGPLAPLGDVALPRVSGSHRSHRLVRLYYPPLKAIVAAPPYTPLPVPSVAAVARRAARLGRGRQIFLVAARGKFLPPAEPFLQSLPPRFRLVERRTFPGVDPLTVYRLSDRGSVDRGSAKPTRGR